MDDRLKFRAYHKKENRIYEVGCLYDNGNVGVLEIDGQTGEPYECLLNSEDIILLQCTGRNDKAGTLIYEGDVVRVIYDGKITIHEIKYFSKEGYPAFDLHPQLDCESNGLSFLESEVFDEISGYWVIGNKFQNPELLSEGAG
jgi:hypothetical protein